MEKFEEDFEQMRIGQGQDIAYSTVTGLKPDLSGPQLVPALLQEERRRTEGEGDAKGEGEDCVSDRDDESSGGESGEDESSEDGSSEGEEGDEGGDRKRKSMQSREHRKGGMILYSGHFQQGENF